MPRNASGTYSLPSGNPVTSGAVIQSTWANNTMSDIGDALTGSLARDGSGGMTGAFKLFDGSSSAPGLAFTNEPSSGIYRPGAGEWWGSVLTSPIFQVSGTGISMATSKVLSLQAGTVGAPALTFTGDNNTGIWSPGADIVAVAAGGSEKLRLTSAGASVTGDLAVTGNSVLTGNVGIGRTPSNKFEVQGTTSVFWDATAANFLSISPGATTTLNVNGAYQFNTGGTARMTIDASGNVGVGVGTSSIFAKLAVSNGSGENFELTPGSATYNGGLLEYINRTSASTRPDFNYYIGSSGAHKFYTNGSERMRVTADGNVGIGVTPNYRLDVAGSANAAAIGTTLPYGTAGQVYSAFRFNNSSFSGGNSEIRNIVNGAMSLGSSLAFLTTQDGSGALTERARIDINGNFLVGTAGSYYLNNKAVILQTSSANSGNALAVATSYAGDVGNAAMYVGKFDSNATTSQVLIKFLIGNSTTGCGQINANGTGAAAFGSWSDRRLKENITDLPPQLANIMALRPVEFDYIESEGGGHQTGFIAQEMQEVYPDAVGERAPDGMLTITGWSKTEARLVKAIQEQQALIQSLTQRIAALEGASNV